MDMRIVAVDDDRDFLDVLGRRLGSLGYRQVTLEDDPERLLSSVEGGSRYDLALIDVSMPQTDGIDVLARIKNASPDTECLMLSAANEARLAVQALRLGAYDYLVKPVPRELLAAALGRALERKRLIDIMHLDREPQALRLRNGAAFGAIVTRSHTMLRLLREAELHAASAMPVLVTGESGTGKELLARAIHLASPRASQPFVPINMSSIAPTLFEAELFGHTRGAFTGADSSRRGYLEQASGGTLFLDEIGDLSPALQGKLLRVLQDGELARVGTSRQTRVDLRIVAATNEDLDRLISTGRFRKDLYYRIRGGWIHLPPLRERSEDLPLLVTHLLSGYEHPGSAPSSVLPETLEYLAAYPFPGNIRELGSVLHAAANLAQGDPIAVKHLPGHVQGHPGKGVRRSFSYTRRGREASSERSSSPGTGAGVRTLAEVEREHVLRVYDQLGRNKSRTAAALGIGLNTLRRKLTSCSGQ